MSGAYSFLKDEFAKRFEPNGEGYLFRNRLGAPGYAVTAAERDQFVAEFDLRVTWSGRAFFVALLVLCLGGAWYAVENAIELTQWMILPVIIGAMIINVAISLWFWGEPVRRLEGRAQVAEALPMATARREALRKLGWDRLGLCVGVAVLVAWQGYTQDPTFSGWSRLWLLGAGVLLVVAAVQAFRKWRLERDPR
jgi:hypothetical protein